jgi:hypothetical protein
MIAMVANQVAVAVVTLGVLCMFAEGFVGSATSVWRCRSASPHVRLLGVAVEVSVCFLFVYAAYDLIVAAWAFAKVEPRTGHAGTTALVVAWVYFIVSMSRGLRAR